MVCDNIFLIPAMKALLAQIENENCHLPRLSMTIIMKITLNLFTRSIESCKRVIDGSRGDFSALSIS